MYHVARRQRYSRTRHARACSRRQIVEAFAKKMGALLAFKDLNGAEIEALKEKIKLKTKSMKLCL